MIHKKNNQRGFAVIVILIVVVIIMILIIAQLYGGLFNKSTVPTALDKQLVELEEHQQQTYFKKNEPAAQQNPENIHSGVTVKKNESGDTPKTENNSLTDTSKKEKSMPLIAKKTPTPVQKKSVPNPIINGTGPGLLKDIGRARKLSRSLNTKVLNDNLVMWKLNHPGKKVTLDNLRKTNFALPALKPHEEFFIENENIGIRFK